MQLEGAAALTRGNWRAYDQFATMVPLRPRPRIGLLKTALGAVALLADWQLTALTPYALGQGEARRGMASDLAWHERLGSKTRAVRLMPDPKSGVSESIGRRGAWFTIAHGSSMNCVQGLRCSSANLRRGINVAIFKSRFAIGDRVKIRYYSGTAVVVAVRFTKDKVLYDVDRDLGGKTLRDVDSNDIGPA